VRICIYTVLQHNCGVGSQMREVSTCLSNRLGKLLSVVTYAPSDNLTLQHTRIPQALVLRSILTIYGPLDYNAIACAFVLTCTYIGPPIFGDASFLLPVAEFPSFPPFLFSLLRCQRLKYFGPLLVRQVIDVLHLFFQRLHHRMKKREFYKGCQLREKNIAIVEGKTDSDHIRHPIEDPLVKSHTIIEGCQVARDADLTSPDHLSKRVRQEVPYVLLSRKTVLVALAHAHQNAPQMPRTRQDLPRRALLGIRAHYFRIL
jgi:hypothetical protein